MPNQIVCPKCYNHGMNKSGWFGDKQRYEYKTCGHRTINGIEDLDLLKQNVKLAKQKQSFQDLNRIERKTFREHIRIENAVGKYNKALKKIFDNYDLSELTIKHDENNKAVGVIQFSDVHINELVNLEQNKYDFNIASAR